MDFNWTSDGYLVVIHDWDNAVKRMFGIEEPRILSLKAFPTLPNNYDLSQLTIEDLVVWLRAHPDVFVETDIKHDNGRGLAVLAQSMGDLKARIVPQIYYFEEYRTARDLGFENIILTLYLMGGRDKDILNLMGGRDKDILKFAKCHSLFAVTMSAARSKTELPKKLAAMGVKAYVHAINQPTLHDAFKENGVHGKYTDFIFPSDPEAIDCTSYQNRANWSESERKDRDSQGKRRSGQPCLFCWKRKIGTAMIFSLASKGGSGQP